MGATGPFADIVGQPRATGALDRALRSGRLFPSLLFHGPEGVGKLATALALARALLCMAAADRPCRDCRSCRAIAEGAFRHPDARAIFPESRKHYEDEQKGLGDPGPPDLQAIQAECLDHPAWEVLIDRVRDAIAVLHRPPTGGRGALLIVDQAHRMGAPAANALLKTLEEPPAHATIVLTAPAPHALLPTIRSRCRPVPFRLVSGTEITNHLVEGHGLGPEEAYLRAGQAGGRIGTALALDLEDYRLRREALVAILESLMVRGDPGMAVARAEAITKGGDPVERELGLMQTLVRDLLLLEAAGQGALAPRLTHVDLRDRLMRLAPALGGRGPDLVAALDSTLQGLRRHGNRQLLVETFLLDLLPDAARRPAVP